MSRSTTKQCASCREAWLEHKVLFLPDQPLSRDQHKRFALSFGEIYRHPFLKAVGKDPDFVKLYSGGDTGSRYVAEGWHTDVTFSPQPPMGSILRALEVPAYGGDTMWLDLEAAFAGLSPPMQEFASSLTAVHSAPRAAFIPDDKSGEVITEPASRRPHASGERPQVLVRQSRYSRESIEGLQPDRVGRAFSRCSTRVVSGPNIRFGFTGRHDMIAMWDNRCTQHRVVADNLDALAQDGTHHVAR